MTSLEELLETIISNNLAMVVIPVKTKVRAEEIMRDIKKRVGYDGLVVASEVDEEEVVQ